MTLALLGDQGASQKSQDSIWSYPSPPVAISVTPPCRSLSIKGAGAGSLVCAYSAGLVRTCGLGSWHGDPGRGNRGENQSKNIEENT